MQDIKQGAQLIKQGKLVAFPTETVYGLGANACDEQACQKIYELKERPANNPLIVHVGNLNKAKELAEFNHDAELLSSLWPGALTMVLPKKSGANLADCVTAGLDTIAIRIPAHKIAYELINQSNLPIAAPSANKSGTLSSTEYEHVKSNFPDGLFILKDTDKIKYGLESTIIDLTTKTPTILRFGFITHEFIESVLEKKVAVSSKSSSIKAPGMLLKHYAPKTKLRVNADQLTQGEVGLNFGNSNLHSKGSMNLSESGNLGEAAVNLFAFLHKLDDYARNNNTNCIAVAPIPNKQIGIAINDRLNRAASAATK